MTMAASSRPAPRTCPACAAAEFATVAARSRFVPEVLPLPADPHDDEPLARYSAMDIPLDKPLTRSAPYFHEGSVATLEDAVKLMAGGGLANPHLGTDELKPAELPPVQLADMLEFLKSLDEPCQLPAPPLPPGA